MKEGRKKGRQVGKKSCWPKVTAPSGLGGVPVIAHLPAGCLGQCFCEVVETD